MGSSFRQNEILQIAQSEGKVTVEDLAERFQVTLQTIRRDLNQLYEQNLLQRVHGGAVIKDNVENLGYTARKTLMAAEKHNIARRQLPRGDSPGAKCGRQPCFALSALPAFALRPARSRMWIGRRAHSGVMIRSDWPVRYSAMLR